MTKYILLFLLIILTAGLYYIGLTFANGAVNFAIYTVLIFVLGITFGTIRDSIYSGKKLSALKREQEKSSISSTESQAKVKVLEAKIQTLEKALENALKNK